MPSGRMALRLRRPDGRLRRPAAQPSPAKTPADTERRGVSAKWPIPTCPSAPKEPAGSDSATAPTQPAATRAVVTTSPAKVRADLRHWRAAPAKRLEAAAVQSAASAPKAECGRQAAPPAPRPGPLASAEAAPQPLVRGRAIPAAVKRQVWERDRGCCSYVDLSSGRRCGSRHLLQIDHVLPFALGGSAEPEQSAAVVRRPSPPPPRRQRRRDGPRCRPCSHRFVWIFG